MGWGEEGLWGRGGDFVINFTHTNCHKLVSSGNSNGVGMKRDYGGGGGGLQSFLLLFLCTNNIMHCNKLQNEHTYEQREYQFL